MITMISRGRGWEWRPARYLHCSPPSSRLRLLTGGPVQAGFRGGPWRTLPVRRGRSPLHAEMCDGMYKSRFPGRLRGVRLSRECSVGKTPTRKVHVNKYPVDLGRRSTLFSVLCGYWGFCQCFITYFVFRSHLIIITQLSVEDSGASWRVL